MLNQILQILKKGNTYSKKDICHMLKLSESSLEAQIDFLERQGYIKQVVLNGCNKKTCIRCNAKGCRQEITLPAMWELS